MPETAPIGAVAEVDELGVLMAQLAPLQKREKELKEKLKAYGRRVLEGALFRCTVTESIEERLDGKAIKTEMGQAWYSAHSKAVVKETVRCAAKTAAS
ncbi:MAG TPA: hypothetical protein VEC60_18865 [Reyranella sp.]|nr:hypothetical protein [Reyranella sp.]